MKKLLLLLCVPFLLCSTDDKKKDESFDKFVYNWGLTFAEMLQKVDEKHYKIAKADECMINACDSFLTHLDPHSGFLDPKTYKRMLESTSGEFFGIGIVIDNTRNKKDKTLLVVDTIPEGPSDKAGLKPWDKIIEIDNKILAGMTTDEATSKLKGERNTKVHVKVLRDGKQDPLAFDITRDVIKEQNLLAFKIPEHNVHYISLNMFTQTATKQIESLLKQAQSTDSKGIILDLRNNSGGLLSAAVDIAGLFLDKGSLVATTKNKHGHETARYSTKRNPIAQTDLPLIVLINNYTASAAEILSGVLKIASNQASKAAHNKPQKKLMVFLAGTKTFGKGSVQEIIPISNNSAIKLTTSLYFLPEDTTIQGIGVTPDFEVDRRIPQTKHMKWVTKFYGREEKLKNYIALGEKSEEKKKKPKEEKKKKRWSERARKILKQDNQFQLALMLVNMFDSAKKHIPHLVSNRTKALDYLQHQFVNMKQINMIEVKA